MDSMQINKLIVSIRRDGTDKFYQAICPYQSGGPNAYCHPMCPHLNKVNNVYRLTCGSERVNFDAYPGPRDIATEAANKLE